MKTVTMLLMETAHLLTARLEQAGIAAVVQDEEGGALMPVDGLNRVRIQVDDSDYAAAQEIARAFEAEELIEVEE